MPEGSPHTSANGKAKRRTASSQQHCCGCREALAAVHARLDQMQVQAEQQKRQQVEADQDRQRDHLVLTGELSAVRRVVIAAGLVLPAPSAREDLCTVQQYGKRHHLSDEAVLSRIHRGTLEADKYGGQRWLIKCTVCTG
jgi:hypothetical protein